MTKKIIIIAFSVILVGVAAYFGWKYYKKATATTTTV